LIATQVALGNLAEAKADAAAFLKEEKGHGITYGTAGQAALPGLLKIEDRLPFKNPEKLKRWKGHLSTCLRRRPAALSQRTPVFLLARTNIIRHPGEKPGSRGVRQTADHVAPGFRLSPE
jgi:hypothetical protein